LEGIHAADGIKEAVHATLKHIKGKINDAWCSANCKFVKLAYISAEQMALEQEKTQLEKKKKKKCPLSKKEKAAKNKMKLKKMKVKTKKKMKKMKKTKRIKVKAKKALMIPHFIQKLESTMGEGADEGEGEGEGGDSEPGPPPPLPGCLPLVDNWGMEFTASAPCYICYPDPKTSKCKFNKTYKYILDPNAL